jgi:oligoribonuclease NrnB/cAMP/cGMP phosphodiesterase (DHH superfamily)
MHNKQRRIKMDKRVCIYHGNCADGFAAACIVREYEPECEFYAGVYQQEPPWEFIKDAHVIIVDFSYKRAVMEKILEVAAFVTIIDHHKSAIEDLNSLNHPNLSKHFDVNHSGAMLTWMYYDGADDSDDAPQLLKHIEDRDLWLFKLPRTREIQAALFSLEHDFDVWSKLLFEVKDLSGLAIAGEAIERKHFKDVKELLKVTQRTMEIGGYVVPVANLPYTMSSDAGHIMAVGHRFAACYWDTPTGRTFSLRSAEDGMDVSQIAVKYGGGGHRNAAGFAVNKYKAALMDRIDVVSSKGELK